MSLISFCKVVILTPSDFSLYRVNKTIIRQYYIENTLKTSLGTFLLILVIIVIVLVFVASFVYRIVSQMDKGVIQLAKTVLRGCESCKTLLVKEYLQRITACDQHVKSQIEFQIINQVRLLNVLLNNHYLLFLRILRSESTLNLVKLLSHEYAFALAHAVRLYYHKRHLVSLLRGICPKLIHVFWKNPSLRKEVVISRVHLLHPHQILSQHSFSSDVEHSWEMIDSLEKLKT